MRGDESVLSGRGRVGVGFVLYRKGNFISLVFLFIRFMRDFRVLFISFLFS